MRNKNILLWAVSTAVIVVVVGVAWIAWHVTSQFHPITAARRASISPSVSQAAAQVDNGVSIPGKIAPNFSLTNQFGHRESLKSFRGKVVVLSFIDSRCTTICPLTAVVFRNVQYDLGAQNKHVVFVAVNANPIHTSINAVYQWSKSHHMLHAWQFLTGSSTSLKTIWAHYYVDSQVLKGGSVSHIPAVYVIGPRGRERWMYLNSASANSIAIGLQVRNLLTHIVPRLPNHAKVPIPPYRHIVYLAGPMGPSRLQGRSFTLPAIMPGGHIHNLSVGTSRQANHATLLEFFATWCPDCQEEMPILKRYTQMANHHAYWPRVVAVDLSQSESSTEQVVAYAHNNRLPFPVALDSHGTVSNEFGVSGIPTQVLVSSQGKILWYHMGPIPLSSLMRHLRLNNK